MAGVRRGGTLQLLRPQLPYNISRSQVVAFSTSFNKLD